MKFSCTQQALAKAFNTVSKAVTGRTTVPILKGILLKTTNEGKLILSATDLDLSIEKTIDVDVYEAGTIVVYAKLFGDIVRKLPNEVVTVEVKDNGNVILKTLNSEFSIIGMPADEFPSIGEIETIVGEFSLDREAFKNMIRRTYFCASTDEARGIVVGILLSLQGNDLTMVALDGFRMAVAREAIGTGEERNIIISGKILFEILKLLSEVEEDLPLTFTLGDKKAIMILGSTKVILRLMDGEFIAYQDLLPKTSNTEMIVERSTLLTAIERASLLAKEGKNNLIRCTIKNNLLCITSASEEGQVKEELIMEKTGEDLEIGFNSKYVIDVLKAVDEDQVKFQLNTSITPCIIRPMNGDAFEYLVLPVRLPSN
ncbi:MAG: DNA polymerase III subunit beta [Anaerovoracaceae bacterium]